MNMVYWYGSDMVIIANDDGFKFTPLVIKLTSPYYPRIYCDFIWR